MAFKLACFFERKTQDFTRYFQSLDTNSCELIVIDRACGHIFAQHTILCSDHVSAHIFGRRLCIIIDHGRSPTGKAQKFCSWLIVAYASLWILE
jgi:hypothetical protein